MADIDITPFAGSEHLQHRSVECRGEPAAFRAIVERTIAFAHAYSETLGSGDFGAAYSMTDSCLRDRMTLDQFVREHQQAEAEFRGPAFEYRIERFVYVLADETARNDKKDRGWRKDIPRERRRSRLLGFWIRNRASNCGCRGRMWITEEDGQFRLADFDFYGD